MLNIEAINFSRVWHNGIDHECLIGNTMGGHCRFTKVRCRQLIGYQMACLGRRPSAKTCHGRMS